VGEDQQKPAVDCYVVWLLQFLAVSAAGDFAQDDVLIASGVAQFVKDFPKPGPIIFVEWTYVGVSDEDATGVRPVGRVFHQSGAEWVEHDIFANVEKSVASAFGRSQDVIVGLMLKARRGDQRRQTRSQKSHRASLV